MLELADVNTYYGQSHILQGVSLHVQAGEVVALLGRNGAGKTTTIRSIIGFTPARSGSIKLQGEPIHTLPPYVIARRGIGLVPQGRRIFSDLTVRENLTLAHRPNGPWNLESVEELFPILCARKGNFGDQLSGGEQQMLAVARALLANPRVLLMDEPSEGLAPRVVEDVSHVLQRLKGAGTTILLVEQNLTLALEAADRLYILNKGKVVFHGTPAELQDQPDLQHLYLGV